MQTKHLCVLIHIRERADLLAFVSDVCDFVTFPCGTCIRCQLWYLIVLIPDLCRLSYYEKGLSVVVFSFLLLLLVLLL